MMQDLLKERLLGRFTKDDMIDLVNADEAIFEQALGIALRNEETLSWRAAWVLYHAMHQGDHRLQVHCPALIEAIHGKSDGHQRELLRILSNLEIPEENEGQLFDLCMNIWEQVGKIPSVRVFAFRMICRLAEKYPDLQSELTFLCQPHYLESLSPGIKNSVERTIRKFS